MSKNVLESKTKNISFKKWPIRLHEYMIFRNEKDSVRSLVLKIHNQSQYHIHQIEVKIEQFNAQENRIYKAEYVFDGLNVSADAKCTPPEKIELHESCVSIEYELLRAEAKHDTWENGSWTNKQNDQNPKQKQNEMSHNISTISHKNLSFPYFITGCLLVFFVIAVITIFNALNA